MKASGDGGVVLSCEICSSTSLSLMYPLIEPVRQITVSNPNNSARDGISNVP
jgi:hypothetical protein